MAAPGAAVPAGWSERDTPVGHRAGRIDPGSFPERPERLTSQEGEFRLFCFRDESILIAAVAPSRTLEARRKDVEALFASIALERSSPTHVTEQRRPAPAPSSSSPPRDESLVHEVQWGDQTLSQIAGWYTGSFENWDLLRSTGVDDCCVPIEPGREIRIPRELLVRTAPMPEDAVRPLREEVLEEKPSAERRAGTEADLPAVIGPKF